jgi:hypothetical protein
MHGKITGEFHLCVLQIGSSVCRNHPNLWYDLNPQAGRVIAALPSGRGEESPHSLEHDTG